MINLNLQFFAKDLAWQRSYRKSKAITKASEEVKMREAETKTQYSKPDTEKKLKRGEVVSTVSAHEQYQVFVSENGKERPYTDKEGNYVYRTGAEVVNKMIYNRNRGAWESKAQLNAKKKDGLIKIRKYIIRKKT